MAKLYSWTTFPRSDIHPRDQINVGDPVKRSDFDELSDDEFEELLSIGAIRDQEYPIPKDDNGNFVYEGSPREYILAQAAAMEEGGPFAYSDRQASWKVPQMQERASKALEESDFDPGDIAGAGENEEAAAEQDKAERSQGSRLAMGGLTPGSQVKASADKSKSK